MIKRVHLDIVAHAASFFGWKRIYVGNRYRQLHPRFRQAILAHEKGHIAGHHTEWRIVCLLLCPFLLGVLCRWQEFRADEYADQRGYGQLLSQFLSSDAPGTFLHPSQAMRRLKLKQYEQLRSAPVKGKPSNGLA